MDYGNTSQGNQWIEKGSSVAPGLIGAAVGMVLGDMMHRSARRPLAFALLCLGVAAVTPSVVGVVKDKVAGPQTKRGSRRTLEGIRSAGAVEGLDFAGDDLLEEELYV